MPFDLPPTTSRVIGFTVDTRTVDGRQFMLDMLREQRRADAMRTPLGKVRSALDLHRKTQRDARLNIPWGYFATVAESRDWVRQSVVEARAAAAAFDAVPRRMAS